MDSDSFEIRQLSNEEGSGVEADNQYPDSTRSLDSLREMRLTALLSDLIEEHGKTRTADVLGVNPRTLTRYEESRRLTPTLAGALERRLLEGGGSAASVLRRRLGELEDGLAELERQLQAEVEAVRKEARAAEERQADALADLAKRLAALEAAGQDSSKPTSVPQSAPQKPLTVRPRRDYDALVTAEPEPGEELVFGSAATEVIVAWREARDAVGHCTNSLDRLNARERWLELEIELIGKHELTLPPASYPWDWGDRRQEVRRRSEALDEVIRDRKMLKLRRFLTYGLWRN